MKLKPEKKNILGSELRYAFIPAVRDKVDSPFLESPSKYNLPVLFIASVMTPNLTGKTRSNVSNARTKKDMLNRGELVKASDQQLYVFMGAVGVYDPPHDPKETYWLDLVEWCPEWLLRPFHERGKCFAALWKGGIEFCLEVSSSE